MKPRSRVRMAKYHFYGSIVVGILVCGGMATELIPSKISQIILMAISFYAVTVSAADVWLTADVREEQEEEK